MASSGMRGVLTPVSLRSNGEKLRQLLHSFEFPINNTYSLIKYNALLSTSGIMKSEQTFCHHQTHRQWLGLRDNGTDVPWIRWKPRPSWGSGSFFKVLRILSVLKKRTVDKTQNKKTTNTPLIPKPKIFREERICSKRVDNLNYATLLFHLSIWEDRCL